MCAKRQRATNSKSKTVGALPVPTSERLHADVADRPAWRYAIAGLLMAVMATFYFMQDLFQVNNLNDFGEYMLRAQDWLDGSYALTGGSDILLSVVEYFALRMHPHDFFAFYGLTGWILTTFTLIACFVFLVRQTPTLPPFWIKVGMTALFLSIPHFVLATRTVDQSLLFGACLLLWFATYDVPWAGFIGVLTWFSRPEAIIIIPLYILVYVIHRERRKAILINAASFVVLLLAFKFLVAGQASGTDTAQYQQFSFLDKIGWDWLGNLLLRIANTPMVITMYAMEALQNGLLVFLFCLGIVLSVRQRSAVLMYATLLAYYMAHSVFTADVEPGNYASFASIIQRMHAEDAYFIVNGYNKFDPLVEHGRYRLVLYPALAFFVINAVFIALRTVLRSDSKRAFVGYFVAGLSAVVATYYVSLRYPTVAATYRTSTQLEQMSPLYNVALQLRPMALHNPRVFVAGFCDQSLGSFMSEFAVFSGVREFVLRVCPNTEYWHDGPEKISPVGDYVRSNPFNPDALMLFRDIRAPRKENSDPAFVQKLRDATGTLELAPLRAAGITLIIAGRDLPIPHLRRLGTVGRVRYYAVVDPST